MRIEELYRYIADPESLSVEELPSLYELSERYPYDQALQTLLLKALYANEDLRFASELKKRSMFVPGLEPLFYLLKREEYGLWDTEQLPSQAAPAKRAADEAFQMIDTLLKEDFSEGTEPAALDDELSICSIPEYSLEDAPSIVPDDSVSSVSLPAVDSPEIPVESKASAPTSSASEVQTSLADDDDLLTETLSKVYIKQGKYEQAKKIISTLNLKYPKKSSYFAQQIKFLEKLIINQKA